MQQAKLLAHSIPASLARTAHSPRLRARIDRLRQEDSRNLRQRQSACACACMRGVSTGTRMGPFPDHAVLVRRPISPGTFRISRAPPVGYSSPPFDLARSGETCVICSRRTGVEECQYFALRLELNERRRGSHGNQKDGKDRKEHLLCDLGAEKP